MPASARRLLSAVFVLVFVGLTAPSQPGTIRKQERFAAVASILVRTAAVSRE
jgi:hypothetical protein